MEVLINLHKILFFYTTFGNRTRGSRLEGGYVTTTPIPFIFLKGNFSKNTKYLADIKLIS